MKNKILFLMILFVCAPAVGWSQIDDDIEIALEDEFTARPSDITESTAAVFNNYRPGDGLRITSVDRKYMMTLSGYVQASMMLSKYPGDGDLYSRFRMRRVRLRFQGNALGDRIRYRLSFNMVNGSESDDDTGTLLYDAWIQYRPWANNQFSVSFGQRGNPTEGRETQMSTYSLLLNETSKASSIFATSREVGIFAEGTYKVGNNSYLRPSVALTDGDGSFSRGRRYGGMKLGGRINYLPFGLFRISGETRQSDMVYELTPKLIVGVAYNYNWGVSDRRGGRSGGEILYMNDKDEIDLPNYGKLNADFMFKYRGWSLMGTFTKGWAYVPSSITKRVRNDGTTSTSFEIDGRQDVKAYIENRMMVGSAYMIQGGYLFRNFWSIAGRYTHIDPDRYSYLNNDLYYKRNDICELSVAKYLTKSYAVKIQGTVGLLKTDGEVRRFDDTVIHGWETNFNLMIQIAF